MRYVHLKYKTMKNKLAFVVGTIMVATAVSIVVYVNNEKKDG